MLTKAAFIWTKIWSFCEIVVQFSHLIDGKASEVILIC